MSSDDRSSAGRRSNDDTLSRFLDHLDAVGVDDLSPERLDEALAALRRILAHELRRRGLWTAPPAWLGLIGHQSWGAAALDELLPSAYAHVFLERLNGLLRRRRAGQAIEGIVVGSLRQFVSQRQRDEDPVGARVYSLLHEAAEQLLDAGTLRVEPPLRRRLRDASLLCPAVERGTEADGVPEGTVERWLDDLLVELVVAWHRQPVVDELAARLAALVEAVGCVRFGDVLQPLRRLTRERWQTLWDEEVVPDRLARPDEKMAERDIVETLGRCIARRIDEESNLTRRKTLWRLFNMLRAWAEVGGDDHPPSDRRLAELLDIPRSTVGRLRRELKALAEACRRELAAPTAEATAKASKEGGPLEHRKDPPHALDRAALLARTRAALAQAHAHGNGSSAGGRKPVTVPAEPSDSAPAPGDLLLVPLQAVLDDRDPDDDFDPDAVEWLVCERTDDRVLLVPIDSAPWLGSRDLRLDLGPHDAAIARVGLARQVPVARLAGAVVGGSLEPPAIDTIRGALTESPRGSTLAREVDRDPDYRAWIDAVENLADHLADHAAGPVPGADSDPRTGGGTAGGGTAGGGTAGGDGRVVPFAPRSARRPFNALPWSLAALFALAAVGLGLWNVELRKPRSGFESAVIAFEEVVGLGWTTRSLNKPLDFSPDAAAMKIELGLNTGEYETRGTTLELLDARGRVLRRHEITSDPLPTILTVLRTDLDAGPWVVLRWLDEDGEEIDSEKIAFSMEPADVY